jgi:tetratricopeptide (TPR) repeat protein
MLSEKKYQYAELILAKAFALAKSIEEKVNTLRNMINAAYHQEDTSKVIAQYQQILAIEPSVKTAEYRFNCVNMLFYMKSIL